MSIDIGSIDTLNIHGVNYCRIIVGITKVEAIHYYNKPDLSEKSASLWNRILFIWKDEYRNRAFSEIENKSCKFHNKKSPTLIDDVGFDDIIVSNKIHSKEGYKYDEKVLTIKCYALTNECTHKKFWWKCMYVFFNRWW